MTLYLVSCKITRISDGSIESVLPTVAWESRKRAEDYIRILNDSNLKGKESQYIQMEYFITDVPFLMEEKNDSN